MVPRGAQLGGQRTARTRCGLAGGAVGSEPMISVGAVVNYPPLNATRCSGGLQFQVSYSRPENIFREQTASGRLTIRWRISRSRLIATHQDWERRLEESTWASSTRLIILRRVLRLSCPSPLDKAPRNCSLPEAVPLGAAGNTTGRMARLQRPYVRRRAKPFNSHPVSISSLSKLTKMFAMDGVSIEVLDEKN